jgi:hypothetical protein
MFMGYQNQNAGNQVFFDPESSRYYTQSAPIGFAMGHAYGRPGERTFLDNILGQSNQSQIAKMLAARQPYQYNAPSAQQLFPNVGNPMMGGMQSPFSNMFGGMTSPNMGAMTPTMGMQGQYGAGRFLGRNTGLLGSSSTSMLGT